MIEVSEQKTTVRKNYKTYYRITEHLATEWNQKVKHSVLNKWVVKRGQLGIEMWVKDKNNMQALKLEKAVPFIPQKR